MAEQIALGSVAVALLAFLLAVANFSVGRANLALALFDRRMAVYEAVRKAASLAIISEQEFIQKDGMRHVHRALNDSKFLFGPEVSDYLLTLWKASVDISVFGEEETPDPKRIDRRHQSYATIIDATGQMQALLRPYMAMDHKLPPRWIRRLFG